MKKIFLLIFAIIFLAGCKDQGSVKESKFIVNLEAGAPSVDFLYRDMDQKPFRLSEHKGKVVLLYFWRMKCTECQTELKAIDALHKKYGDRGFVAVSVGADSMHSAPLYKVVEFFDREGFSFVKIRDEDGFVAEAYQVMRAPEAYLIDKDGMIALVQKGYTDWGATEKTELIEKLLAK